LDDFGKWRECYAGGGERYWDCEYCDACGEYGTDGCEYVQRIKLCGLCNWDFLERIAIREFYYEC
jgi:hypothetical protein